MVTELEEETASGVTLTHSGPCVGYDVTGVVSHLGGSAVLPGKETSDGTVSFEDGREDGTVRLPDSTKLCLDRLHLDFELSQQQREIVLVHLKLAVTILFILNI